MTTLFENACKQNDSETVNVCLSGNRPESTECLNKYSQSGIIVASKAGSYDVVRYLISRGATTNAADFQGYTALHYAAQQGHTEVVKYLITEGGANPRATSNKKETALHLAASGGHFDIVVFLLHYFADFKEIQTANCLTPLQLACIKGHVNVVNLLIGQNLEEIRKIHPPTRDSLLHLAARKYSDSDMPRDYFGFPKPEASDGKSNYPLIEKLVLADKCLLFHKNVNLKTPLHEACLIGDLDVVKFLVAHGSDVNARDSKKDTPLHIAARNHYTELVKYLIDQRAYVNALTVTRYSPLHEAAVSGDYESVELLVDNGASVTQKNNYDRTPLQEALKRGFKQIVHFLSKKLRTL
jgi:ankyrin repeat protein